VLVDRNRFLLFSALFGIRLHGLFRYVLGFAVEAAFEAPYRVAHVRTYAAQFAGSENHDYQEQDEEKLPDAYAIDTHIRTTVWLIKFRVHPPGVPS